MLDIRLSKNNIEKKNSLKLFRKMTLYVLKKFKKKVIITESKQGEFPMSYILEHFYRKCDIFVHVPERCTNPNTFLAFRLELTFY